MRAPRGFRIGVALVLSGAVLGFAGDLSAQGKTAFLAEQLRKNTDYRVRIDAALKLGTSDDPAAVKPLCACLDDGSEVESVSIACAAALGKLKKQGVDVCLKKHENHSNKKVKEQVVTSIKTVGNLGGGGGGPADWKCPAQADPAAKHKYYVGVGVKNKTGRPDTEIRPLVEKEMYCKLLKFGRFRFANGDDTDPKKMGPIVTKDKLDGYFLDVLVEPFKYEGGSLKVSLKVTLMTHTRDLKGELGKSLTLPGVTSPSKSDEDDLVKMASEKLVDDFAKLKP
ncbi:MAG: HEAT repeat domain-containing protein [Myxococcales bacterium]|nr:HEAT repeat domain-containing protein [Myxococcales bacterium]